MTNSTACARIIDTCVGGMMHFAYDYDGVGNVTSIVDSRPNMDQTLTYDPLDRLATAVSRRS